VEGDVPVNNDVLLVVNFVNFKIKPAQLSKILIGVGCACVHISICVFCVFFKDNLHIIVSFLDKKINKEGPVIG
jgi:hypothetical protein